VMSRFPAFSAGSVKGDDGFLSSHPSTPSRIETAMNTARSMFGAAGGGETDREGYLSAISGLTFGDSPAQGTIVGQRFIHSASKFTFAVPQGYTLQNSQSAVVGVAGDGEAVDRKSTRLNSSHVKISYAVFCLYAAHRALHSFPTRRSSDLRPGRLSLGHFRPHLRRQPGPGHHCGPALHPFGFQVHLRGAAGLYAAEFAERGGWRGRGRRGGRSEEHTSELQSRENLVCRLLLVRRTPSSTLFPYTTLFRSPTGKAISRPFPASPSATARPRAPLWASASSIRLPSSPSRCRRAIRCRIRRARWLAWPGTARR